MDLDTLTLEAIDNMTVEECQVLLDTWPKTPKGQLKGTRGNPELGGLGFALRGKVIHGGKYKYRDVVYVKAKSHVKLLCTHHGTFIKAPDGHISRGNGCVRCLRNIDNELARFIAECTEKHYGLYNYSSTETFTSVKDKVTVTCKDHGDFLVSVNNHKMGVGCSRCAGQSSDTVYLWMVQDTNTYKLGISSISNLHSRVSRIASTHNVTSVLLTTTTLGHNKARSYEQQTHRRLREAGYQSTLITSGDGHTEFFDLPDDIVAELIMEINNASKQA